jgi:hypothetical protein
VNISLTSRGTSMRPFEFVRIECSDEDYEYFKGYDATVYRPKDFKKDTRRKAMYWDNIYQKPNSKVPPSVFIIGN